MKITWFGGTTLRVYTGGAIVVVDADTAPAGVDRRELGAGADLMVGLAANDAPRVDADRWRPQMARPLEPAPELEFASLGTSTLVVAAPGERILLIADAPELPHLGRWADGAVFVLFGEQGAGLAQAVVELDLAQPKLIALAADETTAGRLFDALDRIDERQQVGIASLEPGLALEV